MSNTSSTVYDRQSIYPTIGKERHLGPSPAPIHDGTTDDYVSVRYDHSACGDPTPSESDPLIGTKKLSAIDRSRIFVRDHKTILSVIVVAFLIFNVFNHFTRCPLYPEVRDQIRKDWDKETLDHKFWKKLRDYDIEEHNKVIIEWQHDEKRHEEEVQRRRAREDKEHEERRKAWQEEIEDILTQQERMRQKWREEALDHQQQQQQHRLEWEKEVARHRHAVEQRQRLEEEQRETQRRRWQRETEDHDRLEEERRKREDEERQKLNMFWSQAEAHQCTTYGTREYTARLMNLPVEWEHRVEACKATPIVIHGVSYLPTACEDRGPGMVIGRWSVNQHEPDCATFWHWFKDKGCTSPGSGKRRIEHYLEILPVGGDWREFCATTPASFLGLHFTGAHECFQYKLGTYGHWQIDDSSC